jgi:5-methylcytosine-specific restriction endonuclease McrA
LLRAYFRGVILTTNTDDVRKNSLILVLVFLSFLIGGKGGLILFFLPISSESSYLVLVYSRFKMKRKNFKDDKLKTRKTKKKPRLSKQIPDAEKCWDAIQKQSQPQIKIKRTKRNNTGNAKTRYREFLHTKYWIIVRKSVLKRDGSKCTMCGSTKKLNAHHLTYDHHYSELEHLSDLITLCETCHKRVHGIAIPKKNKSKKKNITKRQNRTRDIKKIVNTLYDIFHTSNKIIRPEWEIDDWFSFRIIKE